MTVTDNRFGSLRGIAKVALVLAPGGLICLLLWTLYERKRLKEMLDGK